jgi:hypothetical protein
MNAKWASLMGICQEILGVTIKDWIGPFHAGDIPGLLFSSGILTFISVDAVGGSLPQANSPAAVWSSPPTPLPPWEMAGTLCTPHQDPAEPDCDLRHRWRQSFPCPLVHHFLELVSKLFSFSLLYH